jgi:bis(5'-nucleosidyl)-tetraphosphatase
MRSDASCGVIPLMFQQGQWFVLLVQHQAGHWGFPKGHPDKGETPHQTAERELLEETGLAIEEWLSEAALKEFYVFKLKGELVSKQVTYFLARVAGEVVLLEKELRDFKWVLMKEAVDHLTFKEAAELCNKVMKILGERG